MLELSNSKINHISGNHFTLDGFIGAAQMLDPHTGWVDIKPNFEVINGVAHVRGAPYDASVNLTTGAREFYPDKYDHSKYFKVYSPELLLPAPVKSARQNHARIDGQPLLNSIRMPFDWGYLELVFHNTGMRLLAYFREPPPREIFGRDRKIKFDIDTKGLDIDSMLESKYGLGILKPRIVCDEPVTVEESFVKWLSWSHNHGELELGFDFGDLKFPILLENDTIDEQVEADLDDAWDRVSAFSNAGTIIYIGETASLYYSGGFRFTGLAALDGATINADSYLSGYGKARDGPDAETLVYIEAQDNAPNFDGGTYPSQRTGTTASTEWDDPVATVGAWNNSPSIQGPGQEAADNGYFASGVCVILQKEDAQNSTELQQWHSHESGGAGEYAMKLHFDFTAGAAGISIPVVMQQMNQFNGGSYL